MEPSILYPGLHLNPLPALVPPGSIFRGTPPSPVLSAANQCLFCLGNFNLTNPCVILCIEGHCACRRCAFSMTHCAVCSNILLQRGGILPEELLAVFAEDEDQLVSPIDEFYYAQVLAASEQESYGADPYGQSPKRPRLTPPFVAQIPSNMVLELSNHDIIASPGIDFSVGLSNGAISMGSIPTPPPPPPEWPKQRKKPTQPQGIMPRCSSGHKLQTRKFFPDKLCAVCKLTIKKMPGRKCFYCRKCDYMLCINCTPVAYKGIIPIEEPQENAYFRDIQTDHTASCDPLPPIAAITISAPPFIAPAPLPPEAAAPCSTPISASQLK